MGSGYDAIVVGVGGMGSATVYHLAERKKKVLGLERYDIPHSMGSSHGVNRIIRLAYYEDPRYVPLLKRAYQLWRELEAEAGEQLLHITGSIDASDAGGEVFRGSLNSCLIHDIPHLVLDSRELSLRFPAYNLPAGHVALYQEEGGFLLSERCIVSYTHLAQAFGGEIHARERVIDWEATSYGVRVHTDRGIYDAERLIVTAGPWMASLPTGLGPLVSPERQVLGWFQPSDPSLFQPARFPVFNLTVDEGRYYGFPIFGIPGFKVGRYHHLAEPVDPDQMDREPNSADEAILREFVARYFPLADGPVMTLKSCIFSNSPDEHFIIDSMPGREQIILASPCSGHGFKFCSVIGKILADLAVSGATRHDISLFSLDRFAL